MATKSQIIAESNNTYVPNTSGLITPQTVQNLNTDWINASIFPEDTGSMSVKSAATASFLLGSIASASFAEQANSASQAISASTSQFANSATSAISASYALTASFALNVPATASFAISSSFAQSSSFAKSATSSSFASNANTANSATSASYSVTSSLATQNLTTASAVANILTFTKGDGSTFNVTVAQSGSVASASYADTANQANSATSASFATLAANANNATSASYAFTASSATNAANSISASFATSASRAISAASATSATTATSALTSISASQATNANNALTASFVAGVATLSGNNTFTGVTTFNNAVTMSNVLVTGTASIQYLNVVFQSSSVIYSSGSNVLGDAANDTQTLWGTVNVISGPLVVTGSANFASTITGTITNANNATNASTASYVANAFVSASQVGGNDKVSLTTAGGVTTTLTINNVASANSAGSANTATSASFASTANTANSATSASYAFTASSATNAANSISASYAFTASSAIKSLSASYADNANTANSSISASFASTASFVKNALTASFFDGLVASASYALVAETANNALTANVANSALTATSASHADNADTAISASYAATASSADVFVVRTNLTASGLNYPTVDNGDKSFIQTDGLGNLSLEYVDALNDTVYNGEATTLVKGTPVYVSGSQGANPRVFRADAGDPTKMPVTYIIAENISTANTGRATVLGEIDGVNTTGFAPGTIIYVAEGGGYGSTRPTGSASIVQVLGIVTQEGTGGKGLILNPGPNSLPNLQSGYAWVGDATNQPVAVATSSFAGAASAFPFTGSAGITGSLDVVGRLYVPSGSFEITGSATINSGSLIMYSYKALPAANRPFVAMVTQSLNSTNNVISISQGTAQSGSIVISGSGNYVSLNSVATNANFANGATSGFSGQNSYVTVMPITSGSNTLVNTATDRNNRYVPTLVNSNINGTLTVTDNRQTESTAPITFANVNQVGGLTIRLQSGSLSSATSFIGGTGHVFEVTSSGTTAATVSALNNSYLGGTSNTVIVRATGSATTSVNNTIISGNTVRVIIAGSSSLNSTTSVNPSLANSLISGQTLIVTASNAAANSITVLGNFNTADGLLNDSRFTTFAVGTGTAAGSRRTSLHVSASGMTTIVNSAIVTGSLVGNAVSQSVSSNTASLNLTSGNFFNLTLPASTDTYITASGQVPGQTINLKITQGATTGSVTFGAGIKQVSGSAYTVTAAANAVDIVTFISFDETGLYLSNVKNLV